MNRILFFLILVCSSFLSCSTFRKENKEQPIARVYDQYLYASDIEKLFNDDMSEEDSIKVKKSYIDNWVKKQLLLKKAELNLTDEQKDISREIEDYRTSLLTYKYKQQLIQQKLDTAISGKEIEEYYSKNSTNFSLNKNIVKLLYIKLPKTAPNIDQVKELYKSDDKEELKALEDYCYQYANKYDYCRDDWITFNTILKRTPIEVNNQEDFLKNNKYIELEDSSSYYFIKIIDYKLKNMISPLPFVRNDIRNILLNKRKIELLKELETNIYNNALNHGHFEIY